MQRTNARIGDDELFEHAFRHAPIGMALVALDGTFLKVNEALCEFVGYERDALLRLDFQAITHPEDLQKDLIELGRVLEGAASSYQLEKRYLARQGHVMWALLSVSLVRDGDGRPRFFISQIKDITQRKRAESELARFFSTSPDMLAIVEHGERFVLLSPAWLATVGLRPQELMARGLLEFVHPNDRAITKAALEAARAGSTAPFAHRFVGGAGREFWLEWNVSGDELGRLFCIVRDLTPRRAAERDRAWLAAIVENASDAIIGVDAEMRIFSWNEGARTLYGYEPREAIGKSVDMLAPNQATTEEMARVWRRALDGVRHQEYEATLAARSGALIHVHVQVNSVEDHAGNILGWSVTARDISEQRRLTEALARQVDMYGAMVRSLPQGAVSVFDPSLTCVAAGGELLKTLDLDPQDLVGRNLAALTSDPNRDTLARVYEGALRGVSSEVEVKRGARSVLIRAAPVRDTSEAIQGGLVLSLDVTKQREQHAQLERANLMLDAILENIQDGVALMDHRREFLFANRAFSSMFQLAPDSIARLSHEAFVTHAAPHFQDAQDFVARLVLPSSEASSASEFVTRGPARRVLRASMRRVGGSLEAGYLVTWEDVTEVSERLARHEQEAITDSLTKLVNRRGAEAALVRALAQARRTNKPLCVAMIDVDHFKRINDGFGHDVGDDVLRAIASAVASQARSGDLIARWGGEEFLALLPAPLDGAKVFAERTRRSVGALSLAVVGSVTVSIGLAQLDGAEDLDELLRRADRHLYVAKSLGRDRVVG